MASKKRKRPDKDQSNQSGPDRRVLWLPLILSLALATVSLVPRVQASPVLARSFWAAAAVLLVWLAALFVRLRRESAGRALSGLIGEDDEAFVPFVTPN